MACKKKSNNVKKPRMKLHQCGLCDKTFTYSRNLAMHMKTHTGEKPYRCHNCDKTFSYKNSLMSHQKMHIGERPYQNSLSDKSSSPNSYRLRNMKTHTGGKPYQCSHCDKGFTAKQSFALHHKVHSMGELYQCSQCNQTKSIKLILTRIKNEEEVPLLKSNMFTKMTTRLKKYKIESSYEIHEGNQANINKNLRFKLSGHEKEEIEPKKCNKRITNVKKIKKNIIESNELSKDDPQSVLTKDIKGIQVNVTKKVRFQSIPEKEEIRPKKCNKGTTEANKLKEQIKVSEDSSKDDPQPIITRYIKSKSGDENKEEVQVKNSKNLPPKINKTKNITIKILKNKIEDKVSQALVTKNKKSNSYVNFNKQLSEKNKINSKQKITKKKVVKSKKEDSEMQPEDGEIIISDSDEECVIVRSETLLRIKKDTKRETKPLYDMLLAIDSLFDLLEESTEGVWKRTPNQTEQDLYNVLQSLKLVRFEDSSCPSMYNLDINYRQLYIKYSGVDSLILQHALLSKLRYPDCNDIPYEHQEDMTCCLNL